MSDLFGIPVPPQVHRWYKDNVEPWIGALIIAGFLQFGLNTALDIHWGAGLVLTAVLGPCLALLLVAWRRKLYVKYTWPMAGAMLLLTTSFAVVVFAAISTLIYQWDPTTYTAAIEINNGTFTNFYLWHTIDALPGLDLWDTYGAGVPPVRQHGLVAGTTLLCFRALVLSILITAVKDWFVRGPKVTPDRRQQASAPQLV